MLSMILSVSCGPVTTSVLVRSSADAYTFPPRSAWSTPPPRNRPSFGPPAPGAPGMPGCICGIPGCPGIPPPPSDLKTDVISFAAAEALACFSLVMRMS